MRCLKVAPALSCALAGAFSLLWLGAASLAWATPPATGTCTQTDPYERIKCKHDGTAKQIEFMTGLFAQGTLLGDQLTEGQRGQMLAVKKKSERAKGKSDAKDFKKLAKREAKSNKDACHLVPLDPVLDDQNQDGICDFEQFPNSTAACASLETENGKALRCNPAKKNKGKGSDGLECDRICSDEEALTAAEAIEMAAEAEPIEQSYGALESELHKVNGDLENLNGASSTLVSRAAFAEADDACKTPATTPGLDIADVVLHQVSVTARGLAGMANAGCDQTAVALGFGGNGSVVCLVFETAASILEIAYTTVDEILKAEQGQLQAATMACLQKTAGSVTDGFAAVIENANSNAAAIKQNDNVNAASIKQNDNANLATLLNKMEQMRLQLLQAMSTPQGLRDQFPSKPSAP